MIKNNIKIALTVVVAFVAVFAGGYANAADLNFTANTVVTISSHNYTIMNGSKATTMEITPTTLVVTVPTGYTFTLVSYDGYSLANGGVIPQSCSANTNTITIVGGPVTVTPNASSTVCTVSGAGGSPSGGSSSSSSSTAVADTTPPTGTSIVIAGGAVTTSTTAVTLTLAATGATQMMVANDAAFTGGAFETYATSKSWTLTTGNGVKTVYAKFRDAAGNVSVAVSDTITHSSGATVTTPVVTTPVTTTPVVTTPTLSLPYANPTTAAEIAANRTALISYIVTLLQSRQTTTTVSGIPAGFQFTTVLKQGMTSNDVKYLQIFLNSDSATSIGNAGRETTYFGAMTKAAVGKFQIKYGLAGASNAGYGQVGPITRAKLNSLIGL